MCNSSKLDETVDVHIALHFFESVCVVGYMCNVCLPFDDFFSIVQLNLLLHGLSLSVV